MDFEFCIQDPTAPQTRYLYEAVLEAAAKATAWRGLFAFATRGGVDHLIDDPVIHDFMARGGEIDLIVGIDAVTNRQTLERMQYYAGRYANFRPRVFWNDTRGLFHPKVSQFTYADGGKRLIVGSGNLTPGGLMHNFEGYAVIRLARREQADLSSLENFLTRHAADIRPIDDAALERAALNVIRAVPGVPRKGTRPVPRPPLPGAPAAARAVPQAEQLLDRVLIAQVPAAGGRWAQVHFNVDIIEQFFRVTDREVQRVYLTHIRADGSRGDEEVRPVVYSKSNKNHKIEIAAAKGHDYPGAPPILIFRERQLRCFDYMLLMPDETGYAEILGLSDKLPSIGRGMRRGITDTPTLARGWADCPLAIPNAEIPLEL